MDQAQVQVRIVVNDAGGGVGGGGAGGSAGQSNAGPGAAARQPVGMASANIRNATLSAEDLRQLKDLIAERRRLASRGGSNRQNSGDGDRARSTLESVQNLTQAVYGLRPSLGSVGQALTAAGEVTGSTILQGAGKGFTAAQAVVLFGDAIKIAVADALPMFVNATLAGLGIEKGSPIHQGVMGELSKLSTKVTEGSLLAGSAAQAAETTFNMTMTRTRLGGAIDFDQIASTFTQQFEVTRQRKEIEEYIKRDVNQEKVFDLVSQLRKAAMSKLGN